MRAGHPWVWDRSIERLSRQGESGDLAVIFDRRRKFAAIGLYDPTSPISVRVLHQGRPRSIDEDFFIDRLIAAIDRRSRLAGDPATTGFRLVHGENDGLPGLVVDRYANTLVARLDTQAWVPHLSTLLPPLIELTDADRLVLRATRQVAPRLIDPLHDGVVLYGGDPTGPIDFVENDLLFGADVISGQKTGHFLDQRDNRHLAGLRCRDAVVLDMFCNTGGFTVSALAGGARSVLSVDSSPHAIDATVTHVEQNRQVHRFTGGHTTRIGDAFDALESLADARARFDVVIVDPPSFAPNAASLPAARRAYRRLTNLGIGLLGGGGTLVQASCTSRIDDLEFYDLVADEVAAARFRATNMVRTTHPVDHPIGFPQGSYLKAVFADLVPRR